MDKSRKRSRVELTLKSKVELIKNSAGKTQRQLAEEFGIGKTQVQTILKRKAEILEGYEENKDGNRKRLCVRSPMEELNNLMWTWFQRVRSQDVAVSGPMLREKALMFAKQLDIPESDFKASNGWLNRFRERHNISFLKVCGESASVDNDVVKNWLDRIHEIISGYSSRDIYNMDETGVNFRGLPDKSLSVKGQMCKGGKRSKERLTVMLCVNMDGDFEKPFVIGKAAKPRCFRNLDVSKLPVTWRFNKKAWMTGQLYTEWLTDFNRRMKNAKRNVLLLLDNAPGHPELKMSNVKVVFLPANTTSKLQPLDQGIIKCFKACYMKRLLRSVLSKIDNDITASAESVSKQISVLDAIRFISASVKDVSNLTVQKCFLKCGINPQDCQASDEIDDENIPLSELKELIDNSKKRLGLIEPMTADEFITVDNDIPVCETLQDDWEENLVNELQASNEPSSESLSDVEEINEVPEPVVSTKEALSCISKLKTFCTSKNLDNLLELFHNAENQLESTIVQIKCKSQQKSMMDYFK